MITLEVVQAAAIAAIPAIITIFFILQSSFFNLQFFNLQSSIFYLQSPFFNLLSQIFNLQSSIFNLKSSIFNLQSPISNPIHHLAKPPPCPPLRGSLSYLYYLLIYFSFASFLFRRKITAFPTSSCRKSPQTIFNLYFSFFFLFYHKFCKWCYVQFLSSFAC